MASGILAHLRAYRWLWIAVFTIIAAVAWLFPVDKNSFDYMGDILAVALMVAGMLIILQSQDGYISPTVAADMAAEEAGLAETA